MGETNHNMNRAHKNATEAKALVVAAMDVAACNPLLAANKIKSLALEAAKIARETAEIAFLNADLIDDLNSEITDLNDVVKSLKNELKSRGLISS